MKASFQGQMIHQVSDGGLQNLGFAQALAHVRQLVRRGDRTREPTAAMRASVEHAESLARAL